MKTSSNNNNIESKNRVINAVMSDSQLAKHVTDCEIKQYCLYAYTDTNRNTFGKAMQRVLDAHGEWFAFATFFGGQKPCICFDLTGEAYHLLNDTVTETSSEITEAEGVKAAIKREQNDACISSAERERTRLGIKVGDRVWCKHGEVMGTVTAIRIWNPDYAFKVRLDKPVTLFGRTFEETEFRRAGITKNYDRDGMIVGNAQYYAEQLKYGPASIIEYEMAGVALRTESTREDVEPDSREGWGNEYRVTIHHQTGDTTETMTLSETAELLARMYQEEQQAA